MCEHIQKRDTSPRQDVVAMNENETGNRAMQTAESMNSRYIVIYSFNVAQYIFYDIDYS